MVIKKQKMMLGIMTLLVSASSAYGQYNVDHNTSAYSSTAALQAVVEIGSDQSISVGTVSASNFGTSHKDILLTKTDALGNIIWNYRYGQTDQNETGHGITLSWDAEHVIIVGSKSFNGIINNPALALRDAITLKVRISDGAVIWSTTHGAFSNDDEALLIERVNSPSIGSVFSEKSYIVVGRSTGDPAQSYGRMYAFRLSESGGEIWSRRYLLTQNFPIISVNPFSMVKNGSNKLMIAGIQEEVNRPNKMFTTGISTINGSVTDDFIEYSVSNVYHIKECAIAKDPDGSGFALAFTTDNFTGNCIAGNNPSPNSVDRIGVMRLFPDRLVRWTGIYWKPQALGQKGVAIEINGGTYNIATSYDVNPYVTHSGLLRLQKITSLVIDCHIYHPSILNPLGASIDCMIPAKSGGYILKSTILGTNGFSLIKTNNLGDSNCDELVPIVNCNTISTSIVQKYSEHNYGSVALHFSPRTQAVYNSIVCSDPFGLKSKNDLLDTPSDKMIVYPSPLESDQDVVNIKFTTKLDGVSAKIHVLNTIGQEVFTHNIVLKEGENRTSFNTPKLTPGMHMIVVETDTEVLERGKLLKQ